MKRHVIAFFFIICLVVSCATGYNLDIIINYPNSNLPNGFSNFFVRGNSLGLSWNNGQACQKIGTNQWKTTVPFATGGQSAQLKVLMNDQAWQIGPNVIVSNLPGSDCKIQLYPYFFETSGSLNIIPNIYSDKLKNYRDLIIYTGPGYNENSLQTIENVIVMHDGENLFNASTSFGGVAWMVQNTIEGLINGGAMDPNIVVIGVYNTPNRINEYTYSYDPTVGSGGQGNLYLDFLEKVVVPKVASSYRIATGRANLGMIGSSLGGLISCYAGWTRSSVWQKVGCMSSSFWWNSQDFNNTILVKYPKPSQTTYFYLDSGNAGPDQDDLVQTITVRDHMQKLGFQLNQTIFYYMQDGGRHNEKYWGERFWVPMIDLYPPTPVKILAA